MFIFIYIILKVPVRAECLRNKVSLSKFPDRKKVSSCKCCLKTNLLLKRVNCCKMSAAKNSTWVVLQVAQFLCSPLKRLCGWIHLLLCQ